MAAYRIQLRARADLQFAFSGRSLLATDLHGHIGDHPASGFFLDNTRYLSTEQWSTDGASLRPVAASPVGASALLSHHQLATADGGARPVYLSIARFVDGGLRTAATLRNHGREAVRVPVGVRLAADFADIREIEEGARRQNADTEHEWRAAERELVLRYAHPRLARAVAIRVEADDAEVGFVDGALCFVMSLEAQSTAEIAWAVVPIVDGVRHAPARRSFAEVGGSPLDTVTRSLREEMPRLTTSVPAVASAWRTAVEDLASLPLGLDDAPAAPIAGIPIYVEFFGRDTLTAGWQALLATSDMLRDALVANAHRQGSRIDDWRDEEPGKLIHRARGGAVSDLGLDPFDAYYGDWATPPDFLVMLGQYLAWTNDRDTVRRLLPAARAALDWLDRYGDADRDGFLEYDTRSPHGDKNQGWKDSDDAIVDEHGEAPANPLATSELQAYWFAALQQAALVFAMFGDVGYAADLLRQARSLKRRFNRVFWMPDVGLYGLGLTREKRLMRTIGSNDGHLLAAGVVPPARGRRVARRLMRPDLFSGWGIRTLAQTHPAYDPFSYHRGSVWPVEQATAAFGMARYGAWDELHRLAEGFFASAELFEEHRLPEVIGGLPRDEITPHPGVYPASCEPQAWSASAVVMLVQAMLGMVAFAPAGLLLVDPHLPPWLPDLRLEGVRVGRARVDLEFELTSSGATRHRVLRRDGWVRVVRQPPPQGPGADPMGRVWSALSSLPRS